MKSGATRRARTGSRVRWFVVLWVAGVAALGAVALIIRLVLHAAGMRS